MEQIDIGRIAQEIRRIRRVPFLGRILQRSRVISKSAAKTLTKTAVMFFTVPLIFFASICIMGYIMVIFQTPESISFLQAIGHTPIMGFTGLALSALTLIAFALIALASIAQFASFVITPLLLLAAKRVSNLSNQIVQFSLGDFQEGSIVFLECRVNFQWHCQKISGFVSAPSSFVY